MFHDNKLQPLNSEPCIPILSEGAANSSDLPTVGQVHHTYDEWPAAWCD